MVQLDSGNQFAKWKQEEDKRDAAQENTEMNDDEENKDRVVIGGRADQAVTSGETDGEMQMIEMAGTMIGGRRRGISGKTGHAAGNTMQAKNPEKTQRARGGYKRKISQKW